MSGKPFDVKAQKKVFKPASLMGPRSGLPMVVESGEDGTITRIRPLHYDDYTDFESKHPWKIEARGSSFEPPRKTLPGCYYTAYKKRVYSNNRVRYPLKRVDWDPKGERNPQNRGKSKYVRISWDEAAQLIADELLRVKEKYGMSAVLAEADMHGEGKHVAPSHGCMNRLLSLLGGYTVQMRNQDSWEGWGWGSKNVWGGEPVGQIKPAGNQWPDIAKNTQMLLCWAGDPESTAVGFEGYMASRLSQWLHTLGIKFVYVDPALNFSGCYLADKWIPVLPNTDAALYLAIIYTWLVEDSYDKEYVKTHAVGYDEFFDYVLGKVDGEPKTPEWASGKCGVPEWTIKALAREWARKITSVAIGNGGPGIRGPHSTEPARLQSICLGMQGLGKPGRHQAKWLEWHNYTEYPLPFQGEEKSTIAHRAEVVRPPEPSPEEEARRQENLQKLLAAGEMEAYLHQDGQLKGNYRLTKQQAEIPELAELLKTMDNAPLQEIPKCMLHDAILKDHIEWWGLYSFCGPASEQWDKHCFPAPGCSKIHMIWSDCPCLVTCWNDGFNMVKAFRSDEIECVVAQHPWLENDCYLADIILPVATMYEMEDIADEEGSGILPCVYHEYPACPPVGESRDDFDCVAAVAKKISDEVYQAYTGNETSVQKCVELFWQGSNVAHLDKDDDFHKKDIFFIPFKPGQQDVPPGIKPFADDPAANPLTTPTGLLEFTSTALKEHFPDDEERPPYPKWIEKSGSHDESLSSERAKKYPLLCMSNHGRWRFHANLDDITWMREVQTMKIRAKDGYQYESMWINPKTAKERGIEFGDIVKVYNERGTVLCGAYVTERLVPGAVYVDHGSRFDPIDAENLDRGGAINLITPHNNISQKATGMVVSGFLVQCEKVTDEEMAEWKRKYPESFARKVDEGCGACLDGWLIK